MANNVSVESARSIPKNADAIGIPVGVTGTVPRQLGLSRSALSEHGFDGKVGQTLVVPSSNGPTLVAVGVGALVLWRRRKTAE